MHTLAKFPLEKDQTHLQRWSLMVAIFMSALSIAGLFWPQALYPGTRQAEAYQTNDLINLVIGLPSILLALWLIRRGKLLGLLFLPGGMLFVFYTYIAYLLGADFSVWSFAWAILVIASGILFYRLNLNLNAVVLKNCLNGKVPAILSGVLLAVFGAGFAFLAFDLLNTSQLSLPHPDLGLAIADIVVSLVWLGVGILLLLKKPVGFAWGLGLLYTAVLLFIGVILLVLIRPWFTSIPFVMEDLVVLAGMTLLSFVPFGLYVRGVIKKKEGDC